MLASRRDALKVILVSFALHALFTVGLPIAILTHTGHPSWTSFPLIPLRLIGAANMVFGAYLYLWSLRCLLLRGTSALPRRRPKALQTNGWYGRVRHPLLLGVVCILLGEAALFVSWPLLLYTLTYWLLVHYGVAMAEERDLERIFGTEYASYARTVPRWIPRFSSGE